MNKNIFYLLTLAIYALFPSVVSAATLSLSPTSSTVANGATFDVQIILNTEGVNTSGTDVQLNFNNSVLNIVDITNGTIYDQYIGKNINNNDGIATLSGIASTQSALFTGTGTFATIRFRAVGGGTGAVTFNYTPGNKNDTNVVNFDTQDEALTGVTNGSYTVTGGAASTSTDTSTGTTTPTTKGGLPVTASSLPLVMLVIASLLLVGGGIYFYRHFKQGQNLPPTPPLS